MVSYCTHGGVWSPIILMVGCGLIELVVGCDLLLLGCGLLLVGCGFRVVGVWLGVGSQVVLVVGCGLLVYSWGVVSGRGTRG